MGDTVGPWAELALEAVAAAGEAVDRLGETAGPRVVVALSIRIGRRHV